MTDRLQTFTVSSQGQGAANNVHNLQFLQDMTVVGVTVCAEAFTGSPSGFNVDINDDGAGVITGVAANSAGTPGSWKSTHFGGSNAPVHVEKDSKVSIDINFSGGTSPTADYEVTIWALAGTK
jgi:hypothetical protein